ncbi:DNA-binding transcriptional regulator, LysR family [Bosea lathyri]|uniref:DNA-binding transcriptional regulator, LysR family n=2 Tax=Bosea lathyri TaxID=1036778 RepID=A0A1H6C975_9HYPH|nr:DNA-binding transcriptional regulator, LysR family [Bosea lathyri]
MRYPNLRHLEIFRTLTQTLSVTETARLLNITQPAVSKAIAQLQDSVGIQMFKRVRGRLQASEDTLRLLAETERLLNQVTLFSDEVTALHEARHGRLSVAAVPALAIGAIAGTVGSFMRSHPKVKVDLSAEMSSRIVTEVAQHRVELGFIHGDPQNLNIRAVPMGESEMVCQFRSDHRLAKKDLISPQDLAGEPLVLLSPASPPNHLIRESFAKVGVHPDVVAEVNASHLSGEITSHTGVAFVDPMSVAANRSRTTICRRFHPSVVLRVYAISSALRPMSRIATEFQSLAQASIHKAIAAAQRAVDRG